MAESVLRQLVAIAEARPFAPIGHVLEHELPQAKAIAAAEPAARVLSTSEQIIKNRWLTIRHELGALRVSVSAGSALWFLADVARQMASRAIKEIDGAAGGES